MKLRKHPFFANHGGPLLIDASLEAVSNDDTLGSMRRAAHRADFDVYKVSVNTVAGHGLVLVPANDRDLALQSQIDDKPRKKTSYASLECRHTLLATVVEKHPNARFQIDIAGTSPDLIPSLRRFITFYQLEERVCLGSRFDTVAELLLEAFPQFPHTFPRIASSHWILSAVLNRHYAPSSPYGVLNLPESFGGLELVDKQFLKGVRKAGLWLNVQVPMERKSLQKLLNLDVDGLIFNSHGLGSLTRASHLLPKSWNQDAMRRSG